MKTKKLGPSILTSCSIGCGGIIVAIIGIAFAISQIASLATDFGGIHTVPGTWTVDVSKAPQTVYVLSSTIDGMAVTPSDVTVKSPSQQSVHVTVSTMTSGQLTLRSNSYTIVAQFTPSHTGNYAVAIHNPKGARIIIVPSSYLQYGLIVVGAAGVGVLITLVGLTLLIVGAVRRRRSNEFGGTMLPPPLPPMSPPPLPTSAADSLLPPPMSTELPEVPPDSHPAQQ